MTRYRGFTMLELMAVVAVIGILAVLAVPTYMDRIVRDQVKAALPLAEIAKPPIAMSWALAQTVPADNAAAGLPAAEKIVSNLVSSVAVRDGAIQMTFGNSASGADQRQNAVAPAGRCRGRADRAGGVGLRQRRRARQDEGLRRKHDQPSQLVAAVRVPWCEALAGMNDATRQNS